MDRLRPRRPIWWLLLPVLLLACGPRLKTHEVKDALVDAEIDQIADDAVELIRAREVRLLDVARRMRSAGLSLCGDQVGPYLGVVVWKGEANYRTEMMDAAGRLWGVTDRLTVVYVQSGSPAEQGGVAVGDVIVEAEGRRARKDIDLFHVIRKARGPVRLGVERDGRQLALELPHEPVCHHEVLLGLSDLLTTEGTRHNHARVTMGFVRFAERDDELALVIGHALGHRILKANTYTDPEDEVAAERLALKLARRAGYDTSGAEAFWESVALEHPFVFSNKPSGFRYLRPHGRYPERILAIRAELRAR